MQVDVGSPGAGPYALTAGPDGALWVTLVHSGEIARVGMDGRVETFAVGSRPSLITPSLWFTLAGDDAHGHLIGERLRLQIREVREDPDVAELMREHGDELVLAQPFRKAALEGQHERVPLLAVALDRRDERVVLDERGGHGLRNRQPLPAVVDDRLHLPLVQRLRPLTGVCAAGMREDDEQRDGVGGQRNSQPVSGAEA